MTATKSLPADTITLDKQDKTPAAVVTSRSQSLFLPPKDSDDSEESPGPSTYVQGSQQQLNRVLKLCDFHPVFHAKLEHFISFITSPHIIQDVPFGEKIIKLSTGEAITTPNVIRTMIPERIVQQNQQYSSETSFTCLSRSTLHRILNVCSASTRKSLQGLDNFSAQGSQAFDDLAKLVDKLVEYGEPHEWGGSIKKPLPSSKEYLRGDYKVKLIFCTIYETTYRVYTQVLQKIYITST